MGLRSTLSTIFYSAKLFFSTMAIIVGLYFRRRRARSIFRKELVASGLSEREADEISEEFPLPLGEVLKLFTRPGR
ncbi:MAG: hypothetical protein ACE5OO_06955 [Candidatus Bathyarchaeia archaeon]